MISDKYNKRNNMITVLIVQNRNLAPSCGKTTIHTNLIFSIIVDIQLLCSIVDGSDHYELYNE